MASEKRLAVAYLARHPEQQQDNIRKLMAKISSLDMQASELNNSINDSARAIERLQSKFHETLGAMEALIGVVAEGIPDDIAKELSIKYLEETQKEAPDAKG